jgi:hypothetical protein
MKQFNFYTECVSTPVRNPKIHYAGAV